MADDLTLSAMTTTQALSPTLVTFPRQEQSSRLTNLPVQLSSFIGRKPHLVEIEQRLSSTRLLTLTGVGGVGKTRLALQVAAQLLPRFADGIWLIDLAPLADPALVPQALAFVLQVRPVPDQPLLATLAEALQHSQLLLVLDNCEHLVSTCAEVVYTLLRACPQLSILVTSREALGVAGEQLWSVPPLSVPPSSSREWPPSSQPDGSIEEYEAVQLFLERARAVRPSLALTEDSTVALVRICQQLDGIPLALELAATRVQGLSLESLATRLADRFQLLTGGSRLVLPRHQTLRATLEWSYDLLTEPEHVFLCRASIFASGWTLEAAEAVCVGDELAGEAVLDTLAQLVKKSLVVVEEHGEQLRYHLLETVRQYAQEKLAASEELAWARDQHLTYFLMLVQHAEGHLFGAEMAAWLRRLDREVDNLRAAFDWALENAAWEQALRLAGELLPFWRLHGRDAQGRDWLEEALCHAGEVGRTPTLALALTGFGWLTMSSYQGDMVSARRHLEESLALWRELGNQRWEAHALAGLGQCARFQGDLATWRQLAEESLTLATQAGDCWNVIRMATWLAAAAREQGDYHLARQQLEQNLAPARELGNPWCLGSLLLNLGELNQLEEQAEQAETCYIEAAHYAQEMIGDMGMYAEIQSHLAQLAHARGDYRRAFLLALGATSIPIRHRDFNIRVYAGLIRLAGAVLFLQKPLLTAQLYGAADAFRTHHQLRLLYVDQARYDRDVAALRATVDEATLTATWEKGRQLTPEQALALVEPLVDSFETAPTIEVPNSPPPAPAPFAPGASQVPANLTRREQEVLRLLAQGWTSTQIAEQLVIGVVTVNFHVRSIYSKLGVSSRSAATRYAIEHQLV
jgi:predicted ATPase/DNA-binding CsgD family transcriptional regulator